VQDHQASQMVCDYEESSVPNGGGFCEYDGAMLYGILLGLSTYLQRLHFPQKIYYGRRQTQLAKISTSHVL
jgi:hypothetical protein